MKFGIQMPTAKEGLSIPTPFFRPTGFTRVAQIAERLGYNSVWCNDQYEPQDFVRQRFATIPNFFDVLTLQTAAAADIPEEEEE